MGYLGGGGGTWRRGALAAHCSPGLERRSTDDGSADVARGSHHVRFHSDSAIVGPCNANATWDSGYLQLTKVGVGPWRTRPTAAKTAGPKPDPTMQQQTEGGREPGGERERRGAWRARAADAAGSSTPLPLPLPLTSLLLPCLLRGRGRGGGEELGGRAVEKRGGWLQWLSAGRAACSSVGEPGAGAPPANSVQLSQP